MQKHFSRYDRSESLGGREREHGSESTGARAQEREHGSEITGARAQAGARVQEREHIIAVDVVVLDIDVEA